jgi:hypothetical protein
MSGNTLLNSKRPVLSSAGPVSLGEAQGTWRAKELLQQTMSGMNLAQASHANHADNYTSRVLFKKAYKLSVQVYNARFCGHSMN